MFRPMATTVCAALFGSLLLALTMIPMLASLSFRKAVLRRLGRGHEQTWMKALNNAYVRQLEWAIDHRAVTVGAAAVLLAVAVGSLFFIGTEFMPRLDEGSILVETRKLPGVSLTDSVEISKRIEQRLRAFPEIADVVIKIGRPDFATEAMGINYNGLNGIRACDLVLRTVKIVGGKIVITRVATWRTPACFSCGTGS
ncbi:MAG: hypothetical protein DMG49_26465 [Acidobacteria bacterium]|nr:MAG: hypothetical protein DMG49_26465 [Acidobacteriota bacterium]